MTADRAATLRAAAARKRERTTARARAAMRELDQRGEESSFQSVARHAGVSRQWLYEQPELRKEIERLRGIRRDRATRVPSAERASEASLRQRVATVCEENQGLREENKALKSALALAYGARRDAASPAPRRKA